MGQRAKPYNWIRMGLVLFLAAVSAFGAWKTLRFGADIDESYAVTLGIRLSHGDRLFREMWEVHQTSAVLYAPLILLFERLTGGVEGLLLYLRAVGLLVQLALAVYGFRVMRRWTAPSLALFLSALYFNFTPKQIQSPDFTQLLYWGSFLLGLSLLEFARTARRRYVAVAALALCVCVLAYPYAVLLFPVCLLLLAPLSRNGAWEGETQARRTEKAEKDGSPLRRRFWVCAGIFTLTCAGLGIVFLAYVLSGLSLKELAENVPCVLMDASHDQSVLQMWVDHIRSFRDMLSRTVLLLLLTEAALRVFRKRGRKTGEWILAVSCAGQAVWCVCQFHTIRKVNYLILLPLIPQLCLFGLYVFWVLMREEAREKKMRREEGSRCPAAGGRDIDLLLALGIPSVGATAAVLSSSNLPTHYSMGFLLPALMALCMTVQRSLCRGRETKPESHSRVPAVGLRALLLTFGVLLLVTRVFLVRFTSTQRKNLFEGYYETNHGSLKGIRLGAFDYRQYEAKTAVLAQQVTGEDVFLYVGCDMFLYSQLPCPIGTGNTISTPVFGEQLLLYYEKYPDRMPTVLFVDREYVSDFSQALEREPFQSFVSAHYVEDETVRDVPVDVYRRIEETAGGR